MEYSEFLRNPKVKIDFNFKFCEFKTDFLKKFESSGLSKEYLSVFAIKTAFIITDFYFTELFKDKDTISELERA
jgi:hypothetical protein